MARTLRPLWLFGGAFLAALLAGGGLWWAARDRPSALPAAAIAPAALFAASFKDTRGVAQPLGQFEGRTLVLNFWATWCAPCREEMPAFVRLQAAWASKGVQFVGLAQDEPGAVERFGRDLAINYPLLVGGEDVGELSRRLGNRLGVLPHTVIFDGTGRILDVKVGTYSEEDLARKLAAFAGKNG